MILVHVFLVLPVELIVSLLTWILSAIQRLPDFQLGKSSLAIAVPESVSRTIRMTSIIEFARRVAADLQGLETCVKVISFERIAGITLTQIPVFVRIACYSAFRRTKNVSEVDCTAGTPAFMSCCEMFIISLVFIWTFTTEPYLDL